MSAGNANFFVWFVWAASATLRVIVSSVSLKFIIFFRNFQNPILGTFLRLSRSAQQQLAIEERMIVAYILYLLFDTKFAQYCRRIAMLDANRQFSIP